MEAGDFGWIVFLAWVVSFYRIIHVSMLRGETLFVGGGGTICWWEGDIICSWGGGGGGGGAWALISGQRFLTHDILPAAQVSPTPRCNFGRII